MSDFLKEAGTTLVYAIRDNDAGHNIPSMSMGQTADGKNIVAKAVFADKESADLMAAHMNTQPGCHENRFEVLIVELWRPTDIELYVRQRLRDKEKEDNTPKIQLLN